jgi:hypothetical protein
MRNAKSTESPATTPYRCDTSARGRNCVALARDNPIASLDDRIAFVENGHKYLVDGLPFKGRSVTAVLKDQFEGEAFEAAVVIRRNLASWRRKPQSKYGAVVAGKTDDEAQAAIEAVWNDANRLGTLTHLVCEQRCNGVEPLESDLAEVGAEDAQFRAFLQDYPTLVPWRTELSVFYSRPDGSVSIVGQLDALFKCSETGKLLLVDFKRVPKSLAPDEHDWGRSGVGVMEGCLGNKYNQFSLQCHLYAAMAEQHGVNVDQCMILQMHEELPAYKLIRCCDLASEAKQILAAL